jgi:hypothetical protein
MAFNIECNAKSFQADSLKSHAKAHIDGEELFEGMARLHQKH